MSIHADEALVLGTRPYSNTSLIATLFSRKMGKVRLVARGVRSPKNRIGIGLEPATHVYTEWSIRSGADLGTLRSCETLTVFHRLWSDMDAMNLAGRILRTVDRVFGVSEGDEEHFGLAHAALEAIEAGGELESVEALFMAILLGRMGLAPGLTYCTSCDKKPGTEGASLDLASGELRCGRCPLPAMQGMRLKSGAIKTLKEIMNLEAGKIRSVRIHASLRREVIGAASAFLSFHTGQSLPAQTRKSR